MKSNPDVLAWNRRLREDETRRKLDAGASYVPSFHDEEFREELRESGTRVVIWTAWPKHDEFFFDPTLETSAKIGFSDPRSKRERLRNASADGDSLGGDLVPCPEPKPRGRPRPAVLQYPSLLQPVFYAACFRELGYVGIRTGKGKKPANEVRLLRRFLSEYHGKGWPQAQLVHATGRAKSSVARIISEEREKSEGLSSLPAPSVYTYWRSLAPVRIDGRRAEATCVAHPSTPTWLDDAGRCRCVTCYRPILKPSEVPVPRRTDAGGRRDDRPPRLLLRALSRRATPRQTPALIGRVHDSESVPRAHVDGSGSR